MLALSACTQLPCPQPGPPGVGGMVRGRVLDLEGQAIAAASVAPADVTGAAIPGMMRARTNDQGEFWAAQLPLGFQYVLVARFPGANGLVLSTLARPSADAPTAHDITPATSLVVLATMKGRAGMPGPFTPTTFAQVVARVQRALSQTQKPDMRDAGAMTDWLTARRGEDQALATLLDDLARESAQPGSREQLEAAVGAAPVGPLDAFKPFF